MTCRTPGIVHGIGALRDDDRSRGDRQQSVPDHPQRCAVVHWERVRRQARLQLRLGRLSLQLARHQHGTFSPLYRHSLTWIARPGEDGKLTGSPGKYTAGTTKGPM